MITVFISAEVVWRGAQWIYM